MPTHRSITLRRDNTCDAMFATQEPGGGDRAAELVRALARDWKVPCEDGQIAALSSYATSLLHWSARINLTAARTIDVLVAEHFPDAFALARAIVEPGRAIDVGSGG